jgi:tetratricopeptide (TPR) repeat protein
MILRFALAFCLLLPAGLAAQKKPTTTVQTRSAEVYLERARNANPADRTGFLKQALTVLMKGAPQDGDNPRLWFLAGQAYAQLDDLAGADSSFDRAQTLHPEYAREIDPVRLELYVKSFNAAVAAVRANRVEEALSNLESADRIYRGRPDALVLMGTLRARSGDLATAEQNLRSALEVARGPASQGLALDALALWKEQEQSAVQQLAAILADQGKHEEAAQLYRDMVRANPDDTGARVQLAAALGRAGKMDMATKAYQELLERQDLSAAELFDIGVELYRAEQFEPAATAFRRAGQRNPHNRDALYNLGQALYAVSGKHEASRKAASGTEAERLTASLKAVSEEMLSAGERLRALDPNNKSALVMIANAQRVLAEAEPAAAQQWKTKMLATLQEIEALPFEVADVRTSAEPNQVRISGQLTNLKAAPGSQATLEFIIVDETGATLATERAVITVPRVGESASFSLQAATPKPAGGWSYRVSR